MVSPLLRLTRARRRLTSYPRRAPGVGRVIGRRRVRIGLGLGLGLGLRVTGYGVGLDLGARLGRAAA